MVSKAKLYIKLDDLESQLLERLVPHLENSAQGNNDLIFCVKGYHKLSQFMSKNDKLTTELVAIGSEILALREKLAEPDEGTIAERICWYCREWGGVNNKQRLSAQVLAQQFLEEIQQTNKDIKLH